MPEGAASVAPFAIPTPSLEMSKMAKKAEDGATNVQVKLKCVYSGAEGDPGPGAVISVDAEEAERLIGLGAAEAYTAEAPAADGSAT